MKRTYYLFAILLIINGLTWAQSITLTPNTPASPTKGTMVFDNVTNQLKYWNGSAWVSLTGTGGGGSNYWELNGVGGNVIKNTNAGGFWSANPTLVTGLNSSIVAPTNGEGTRLMWLPYASAFRVGTVRNNLSNEGTWWDTSNIGLYSIGIGQNTKASASGAISIGFNSQAKESSSITLGAFSEAKGLNSLAIGNVAVSEGWRAIALGSEAYALGNHAVAIGYGTVALALGSTSVGSFNENGGYTDATVANPNDRIFQVGNGTSIGRSNAVTILRNGRVGIGIVSPLATFHVQGTSIFGGNLGIGTTSPVAPFHVQGTSIFGGYVGIGTTSPIAPLHIEVTTLLAEANYHFFNWQYANPTQISILPNNTSYVSLLAGGDIVTRGTIASAQTVTTSDARIKNILGISDNQKDLETLRRLKITDYRYKDVANWGNQTFKKVIAQQVEEVYPQAVRKQTSTIPDVYCLAEKVEYNELKKELTVTLSKNYGIKVGDKIDLIHAEKGRMQAEVIAVSGNDFTVKNWLYLADKIFVYGREVNDFRVVDYEALSMLGISAIQALLQRLEKAEDQIQTLQRGLMELKENTNKRFEQLEALLSKEH